MRVIIIIQLLLATMVVSAQTEIIGIWRLTEMTIGGEKVKVHSMHVDFNQDGKLYISGRYFGTWNHNKKTLLANSEMQLDIINGNNKILKLTNEDLVLENDENGTHTFKRASLPYGQEYKNQIVGEYLFLKIEEKEKHVSMGNSVFNFKNNGTLYIQSMFFGQWSFDNKTKKISIITTEEKDDLNSDSKVIKSGNELVFKTNDGSILFFERLDYNKISEINNESGLIGLWKIDINFNEMASEEAVEGVSEEIVEEVIEEGSRKSNSEEYYQNNDTHNSIETYYLSLESTNKYNYGQGSGNSTGMWIFNKKNMTLYVIGRYSPFSGTNSIINIDDEKFVFINSKGNKCTAIKTNTN